MRADRAAETRTQGGARVELVAPAFAREADNAAASVAQDGAQ